MPGMYLLFSDCMADASCNRSMDMIMLALHNSREREKEEWIALFTLADARFWFESARVVEENVAAVLIFEWKT